MKKNFYDTCSLLKGQEKCFQDFFYVSSQSLKELEHIKTSGNKDEKTKYEARKISHLLGENFGRYSVIEFPVESTLEEFNLNKDADNIIMAQAYLINKEDSIVFYTEDICCKNIATGIFKLNVSSFINDDVEALYKGYKEISISEEDMAYFYLKGKNTRHFSDGMNCQHIER